MAYLDLTLDVDTDSLARGMAWNMSYEDLVEFVLELDARVDDIDFTMDLRDALNMELEREGVETE